jgi:hypothetical protein
MLKGMPKEEKISGGWEKTEADLSGEDRRGKKGTFTWLGIICFIRDYQDCECLGGVRVVDRRRTT